MKHVIEEPVDIICTNGTISQAKLDEFAETLFDKDVYILVDADESGEKLRRQLMRELPQASHLYIDRVYKEVASAPSQHVAEVLFRSKHPGTYKIFIIKRIEVRFNRCKNFKKKS